MHHQYPPVREVLLSEAETKPCKWAATVNWKGSTGNNIEIDLFQENWNRKMKKLIKAMILLITFDTVGKIWSFME